MENTMIGKYVLVTTEFRGVFAGVLAEEHDDGRRVVLTECRNCVYWSADIKGFLGLATAGPSDGCRIGPAASRVTLRGVASVTLISDVARAKWEAAPWSK